MTYLTTDKDGYRYEDLTPQNQASMDWLNFLVKHFKVAFNGNLKYDLEDGSVIGKMRAEIAEDIIDQAITWLESDLIEIQISMIENQPEGDD